MTGFEGMPSMFGGVATALGQYSEGFVLGVVLAVVLVQAARKIDADASWLVVPPFVAMAMLPAMHASRVLLTAGAIATLIAVPWLGLKDGLGDYSIRYALENRWIRIGVTALGSFGLLQAVSVAVLIESAVIIGGLGSVWWNHGLRDFVTGVVESRGNNQ